MPFAIHRRCRLVTTALAGALFTLAASTVASDSETPSAQAQLKSFLSERAQPLERAEDWQPLYQAIGERRFVLLGEASHGTKEYYQKRGKISRELIAEHGFRFIAVEGDWPSLAPLNDYVKGRLDEDQSARSVMREAVTRWPEWMWANEEFAEFIEWLRDYNRERPEQEMAGVYGLDMQDPERSMALVLEWLAEHDEEFYPEASRHYQLILDMPENFQGYAQQLVRGGYRMDDELQQVVDRLRAHQGERSSKQLDKPLWAALQNAEAVLQAEAQFYGAAQQSAQSWNARARYMHAALLRFAERHGEASRGIVWAHNTHVGDARATSMGQQGQVNIGHLSRESEGEDGVFILGFGTYRGEVVAASSWGGERQTMEVPPARADSYGLLMHQAGLKTSLLLFDAESRQGDLTTPQYQRAIGVIYRPPNEAYVPSILTQRYDGLIYIDRTEALSPL